MRHKSGHGIEAIDYECKADGQKYLVPSSAVTVTTNLGTQDEGYWYTMVIHCPAHPQEMRAESIDVFRTIGLITNGAASVVVDHANH